MKTFRSLFVIAMVCCSGLWGQGKQGARPLPPGNMKEMVETACTTCHPATMITSAGHTSEDWKLLVERMVSAGAEVPKDKMPAVTEYLSKNFP